MFTKGLFTDSTPLLQPEGTYTHMLNGTIVESPGSVTTEVGNRVIAGLLPDTYPLGSCLLPDGRSILFATGNGISTIYSIKGSAARLLLSDETWSEDNKLNFNQGEFVQAESRINSLGETVIYWTDGIHEPRFLNLDRIPIEEFNIRKLSLFPVLGTLPVFSLEEILSSGGRLKAGAYQFSVAYVADDNTVSNYPFVTNPIYVSDDKEPDNEILDTSQGGQMPDSQFDGSEPGSPTSKAIRFTLSELDTDYDRVRVAVLYHGAQGSANEVAAPEAVILSDIPIVGSSLSFTYTGFENTIAVPLDEVTVPRVAYRRAQALSQLDGVLYLGNLDDNEEISYQKYANNIQVELVTEDIPIAARGSHQDPYVLFDKKGFKRDEVYALYLSFLMDDGSESRAFHIPGRDATSAGGGKADATLTITKGTGSSNTVSSGYIDVNSVVSSTPTAATAKILIQTGPDVPEDPFDFAQLNASFDGVSIERIIRSDMSIDNMLRELESAFRGSTSHDSKWKTSVDLDRNELLFVSRRNSSLDNGKAPWAYITGVNREIQFQSYPSSGGGNGNHSLSSDVVTITTDGVSSTVSVTGLMSGDAREEVAEKFHSAISGISHIADRFTVTRSGTKVNLVARNPGGAYNGTISIENNSGNTYLRKDLLGGQLEGDGFGQGISVVVTPSHTTTTTPVASGMSTVQVAEAVETALLADSWVTTRFDVTRADAAVTLTDKLAQVTYNGQYFGLHTSSTDAVGVEWTGEVFSGGFPDGGDDEREVPVATDVDTLPNIYNYHLYGRKGHNGMAFWENQNETYPENEASEIWSITDDGEGFYTGSTLAGQRVRHHHFPDAKAEPTTYSNHPATGVTATHHKVLGFKLKNVQIPNEIKSHVLGYKVYYASRSSGNRRILAQDGGMPTFYENVAGDPPTISFSHKKLSEGATGTNNKFLSFHPFDLRVTNDNIGAISYLKAVSKWEGDRDEFYNVELFRKIAGRAYIPFNRSEVGLNGFAEEAEGLIADNDREEGKVLIEVPAGVPTDVTEGRPLDYVWDLVVHRTDLYSNFDTQTLVSTGYVHTNLSETESGAIFGGDTVCAAYSYGVAESSIQDDYTGDVSDNVVGSDGKQDYKIDATTGETTYYWNDDHLRQDGFFEMMQNPWLRYNGTESWQNKDSSYIAHREFIDRDSDVPESEKFDFWLGYNSVFGLPNMVGTTIPAKPTARFPESHPTRIIRSAKAQDSLDIESFRIFKDADFLDLPRHRGEIRLLSVAGGLLVPHMKRGFFRTKGREEMAVGDSRAFVGAGDIFSVLPQEIYVTDEGYGGIQNPRTAITTQYGYFWVDKEAKKVLLMSDGVNEISSLGMEQFFRDNLDFELENYGFVPPPYCPECILLSVYDPKTGRIFLTKREKIPTDKFISDFESGKVRFNEGAFEREDYNPITKAVSFLTISYDDKTYFSDGGWTLSYLPRSKAWESFYSFTPRFYFSDLNSFYSVDDSTVYEYGKGRRGQFYGEQHPFEMTWIDNAGAETDKQVAALSFHTVVTDGDTEVLTDTFDEVRIQNSYQDTGTVPVQNLKNARRTKRVWHINRFRDTLSGESSRLPEWASKKRLSDNYHQITLRFTNPLGRKLSLFGSDLINRIARR